MTDGIVLKIQTPLPGAARPDVWLVSDAHGRIFARINERRFPPEVKQAISGRPKIYVMGDYAAKTNTFTYHGPAAEQPW